MSALDGTIGVVSEDQHGPTQEQARELLQETVALVTLASTPGEETVYVAAQAQKAFNLSPPHAMIALATIGVVRYWRLAQTVPTDEQGRTLLAFPREDLTRDIPVTEFKVTALAIQLVEALLDRALISPKAAGAGPTSTQSAVMALMEYDFHGYLSLLDMVLQLGNLVVDIVPEVQSLQELTSVEAVHAEQEWYRRGQSFE